MGVVIGILISVIVVNLISACFMQQAAYAKGYDDSSHAFALSFWLGILGCLYVIALPDLVARKNQEEIIARLTNKKENTQDEKYNYENEDLPPL